MRIGNYNKYRSAVATVTPREAWYSELSIDSSGTSGTNGLAIDSDTLYLKSAGGSSLQALDIARTGKVGLYSAMLPSSTGRLVDWSTAAHDEHLVAAGDEHGVVAVWKNRTPKHTISVHSAACASVQFHPTVADILVTSSNTGATGELKLWSIDSADSNAIWRVTTAGAIHSISVRGDGALVAASTSSGTCMVYDPRQPANSLVGKTAAVHAPDRPTRVLWLGEKSYMLSTGLTKMRERSAALWDQRNLARPLSSLLLQPSTKPLLPLYDEDTQLAYLIEKGDSIVRWVDADPSSATPLSELGSVSLPAQITGCALLPKSRLKVMNGEIARIHLVVGSPGAGTGASVIP
ncbi:hypothetical protein GGI24_003028, partial [Coemansia furcata]